MFLRWPVVAQPAKQNNPSATTPSAKTAESSHTANPATQKELLPTEQTTGTAISLANVNPAVDGKQKSPQSQSKPTGTISMKNNGKTLGVGSIALLSETSFTSVPAPILKAA